MEELLEHSKIDFGIGIKTVVEELLTNAEEDYIKLREINAVLESGEELTDRQHAWLKKYAQDVL